MTWSKADNAGIWWTSCCTTLKSYLENQTPQICIFHLSQDSGWVWLWSDSGVWRVVQDAIATLSLCLTTCSPLSWGSLTGTNTILWQMRLICLLCIAGWNCSCFFAESCWQLSCLWTCLTRRRWSFLLWGQCSVDPRDLLQWQDKEKLIQRDRAVFFHFQGWWEEILGCISLSVPHSQLNCFWGWALWFPDEF